MKTLHVSSLPLKDVISDIAVGFDTDFTESCGIYEMGIPEKYGSGLITGTDFENGLGLIKYDCTFKGDLTFEYSLDRVHPVKFLFCLKGEIRHKFTDESVWHEIPQYKNAIVASSAHHGHCVSFRAGERILYTSLELERRKFQSKISCELSKIAKSWRAMLNDVTARKTFYHDGLYSLKLSLLFEEWDLYDSGDFLKKLYLEGLAYKIMVLQITQFQDDLKSEGKKTVLRKAELNQLMKAVEIIDNRLEDLPTIQDIALEVGLNANKMQQGFREIYDTSVNMYIREKRLETAKTLLLNTDETANAIASTVGYKSQSYLSKMFKETYGILPSEFRRNKEHKSFLPNTGLDLDEPYNT